MDQIITARGLAKTYGPRWKQVEAVRSIDLDVRPGEILGLLGPDGAGKTTTIQMLCGILAPTAGSATVAGVDVVRNPDGLGGKIGYMSEGFTLYGTLSVTENLDFFARLYQVPPDLAAERRERLLRFARLSHARGRRAEHLSGGMKKKLALACALMYAPQVLFLDEPTTGVDPVSRRDFWLLLGDFLDQGLTIVVSTPYLDEAERFHRVALMHQGQIIACDTPAALKASLPGELLDLRAEPQRAAVPRLRGQPEVTHVQVFGERIHMLMDAPDRDLPALQANVAADGIRLSDVRRVTPGLEDVFVRLLEAQRAPNDQPPVLSPSRSLPSSPSLRSRVNSATERLMSDTPQPIDHPSNAVSVAGLTKRFGDMTAVDNVSFGVREGEIFGFLGPNGSGKTTTIRMLCGLLPPDAGTGTVAGHDIRREQRQIKPDIGYMSQKFSLYGDMTVEENLDFYAGVYGVPSGRRAARKRWVLAMAGLIGRERVRTGALSGGWKQRLALGCAVLHEPRVLFLDEPTSGVDPISRRAFWDLIYELSERGVTVFVTTHYLDEAEHCHRLGLIYNGRLIAQGSPANLRTELRGGQLLEVVCPAPLRALRQLQGMDGVLSAGLFGDRVHVVVDDTKRMVAAIGAELARDGHAAQRITPIAVSLEDLFVTLIEREERARATQ